MPLTSRGIPNLPAESNGRTTPSIPTRLAHALLRATPTARQKFAPAGFPESRRGLLRGVLGPGRAVARANSAPPDITAPHSRRAPRAQCRFEPVKADAAPLTSCLGFRRERLASSAPRMRGLERLGPMGSQPTRCDPCSGVGHGAEPPYSLVHLVGADEQPSRHSEAEHRDEALAPYCFG
jgi:hypothetical protein